jgi:erythronate-4-phosphate dehydrogenase
MVIIEFSCKYYFISLCALLTLNPNRLEMKVVIDGRIPFIKGMLESFADVSYISGADITKDHIKDADALIVRTRTRVDKELLSGSSLSFVGTTTIGTDHIDTGWCKANGIKVVSAPGSNSGSVAQYIASAIVLLQKDFSLIPENSTIGVVGVGNVGNKVASLAKTLGYNILLNDPPRARTENTDLFVSLEELVRASDIITLHVPLTHKGKDKTHHLIKTELLNQSKSGSILINTSRGDVIKEEDLMKQIENKRISATVLDVWNKEPDISLELLRRCYMATPHIAGYSVEGKLNATNMILQNFADFFGIVLPTLSTDDLPIPINRDIVIDSTVKSDSEIISEAILHSYSIVKDHKLLLADPLKFEQIRNSYGIRREPHAYRIKGASNLVSIKLKELGFRL